MHDEGTIKITGHEAIRVAEERDLLLCKYADPIEDDRDDLTPSEARAVAREDAGLIYLHIPAEWLEPEDDEPCEDEQGLLDSIRATGGRGMVIYPETLELAEALEARGLIELEAPPDHSRGVAWAIPS